MLRYQNLCCPPRSQTASLVYFVFAVMTATIVDLLLYGSSEYIKTFKMICIQMNIYKCLLLKIIRLKIYFLKTIYAALLSKDHFKKELGKQSLRRMTYFHLIFQCGNFVERHSFRIVQSESLETMRKLCLSTKFPRQKIR